MNEDPDRKEGESEYDFDPTRMVLVIALCSFGYMALRIGSGNNGPTNVYLAYDADNWANVQVMDLPPHGESKQLTHRQVAAVLKIDNLSFDAPNSFRVKNGVRCPVRARFSLSTEIDLRKSRKIDLAWGNHQPVPNQNTPPLEHQLFSILLCEVLYDGWATRAELNGFETEKMDKAFIDREFRAALIAARKSLAERGLFVTRLRLVLDYQVQGEAPGHMECELKSADGENGSIESGCTSQEVHPRFYPVPAIFTL